MQEYRVFSIDRTFQFYKLEKAGVFHGALSRQYVIIISTGLLTVLAITTLVAQSVVVIDLVIKPVVNIVTVGIVWIIDIVLTVEPITVERRTSDPIIKITVVAAIAVGQVSNIMVADVGSTPFETPLQIISMPPINPANLDRRWENEFSKIQTSK